MLPLRKITRGRRIKYFGKRGTIIKCSILKVDEGPVSQGKGIRGRTRYAAAILAKMDYGAFVGGSAYQFDMVRRTLL